MGSNPIRVTNINNQTRKLFSSFLNNNKKIDINKINQDVFSPENEGVFPLDLRDIKMFLGDKSKNNNAHHFRKSEELVKQQTTEKEKKRFLGLFGFLKSNKNENE